LTDSLLADLGGQRTTALLTQLDAAVPWRELAGTIRPVYRNDTHKGGRPNVPVAVMLKVTLLQRWFGLSDPAMQEAIDDRLSFRRFLGLGLQDPGVDHATIALFRQRLHGAGLAATLFDQANRHLLSRGLIVKQGTAVDATILEAPRGRVRDDGTPTRDPSASFTKKHGKAYHGYKAHIATDVNGMVTDYVMDTAKVHDSNRMDQLTEGEDQAVYADSAYMDQQRKARLESKGVFCGVIERRVRGRAQLAAAQKKHNRVCAKVRAIVEMPFAWRKRTEGGRVRYRGLSRNGTDWGLWSIAYNFRRSLSLSPT